MKTANCSHFGMGKKIKIHCFREPIATLFRVTVVLLNGSSPKIPFILFITVVGIKRVVSEVLGITVGRTVRYDQNEDGKLVKHWYCSTPTGSRLLDSAGIHYQ